CLDLRIDEWLPPPKLHPPGAALLCGAKTNLKAHHVLERSGVLANSTTAGAGKITGVQRLKLQDGRELLHAPQLLTDDVFCYLHREGQRKPHGPGLRSNRYPLSMFLGKIDRLDQERRECGSPFFPGRRATLTCALTRS